MNPKGIPPGDQQNRDGCWIGLAALVLLIAGIILLGTSSMEIRTLGSVLAISGFVCVGWSYTKFFYVRQKRNPTKENTP